MLQIDNINLLIRKSNILIKFYYSLRLCCHRFHSSASPGQWLQIIFCRKFAKWNAPHSSLLTELWREWNGIWESIRAMHSAKSNFARHNCEFFAFKVFSRWSRTMPVTKTHITQFDYVGVCEERTILLHPFVRGLMLWQSWRRGQRRRRHRHRCSRRPLRCQNSIKLFTFFFSRALKTKTNLMEKWSMNDSPWTSTSSILHFPRTAPPFHFVISQRHQLSAVRLRSANKCTWFIRNANNIKYNWKWFFACGGEVCGTGAGSRTPFRQHMLVQLFRCAHASRPTTQFHRCYRFYRCTPSSDQRHLNRIVVQWILTMHPYADKPTLTRTTHNYFHYLRPASCVCHSHRIATKKRREKLFKNINSNKQHKHTFTPPPPPPHHLLPLLLIVVLVFLDFHPFFVVDNMQRCNTFCSSLNCAVSRIDYT